MYSFLIGSSAIVLGLVEKYIQTLPFIKMSTIERENRKERENIAKGSFLLQLHS